MPICTPTDNGRDLLRHTHTYTHMELIALPRNESISLADLNHSLHQISQLALFLSSSGTYFVSMASGPCNTPNSSNTYVRTYYMLTTIARCCPFLGRILIFLTRPELCGLESTFPYSNTMTFSRGVEDTKNVYPAKSSFPPTHQATTSSWQYLAWILFSWRHSFFIFSHLVVDAISPNRGSRRYE